MKRNSTDFQSNIKNSYIHGGLFKKTIVRWPIYARLDKTSPVQPFRGSYFEHQPEYQLNKKKYRLLVNLLKKRNSLEKKWRKGPWTESGYQIFRAKNDAIFKQLKHQFGYYKLIHYYNPEDPSDKFGYPFFDLRYVLKPADFKQWIKVVYLECDHLGLEIPKKGRPKNKATYGPEVFYTYFKYLDYAKSNKTKPEINKKPMYWAAEKTLADFQSRKISASTLIRLAKKQRRK